MSESGRAVPRLASASAVWLGVCGQGGAARAALSVRVTQLHLLLTTVNRKCVR